MSDTTVTHVDEGHQYLIDAENDIDTEIALYRESKSYEVDPGYAMLLLGKAILAAGQASKLGLEDVSTTLGSIDATLEEQLDLTYPAPQAGLFTHLARLFR